MIFAVVSALLFGGGVLSTDAPRDAIDLLSIPISAVATVGLFAYSFGVAKLHSRYWTAFAWFFAAWSLLALCVGVFRGSSAGSPVWAILTGSVMVTVFMYFNWLALHRLGRDPQARSPHGFVR
jgi:hypothetical protein